jgi:hypothetical protein
MREFIKKITPYCIRMFYWQLYNKEAYEFHKKKQKTIDGVKNYLKNPHTHELDDEEKQSIYRYLKHRPYNKVGLYPYPFVYKYKSSNIATFFDADRKMYYVLHKNKRLYFPRNWKEKFIKKVYNGLITEQDMDSPHCYETSDFYVKSGDIVADIGTAEGNFALDVVDRAKKLYLFETNPVWIEALEATFAPYKDKVIIVNKYVSDNNNENNITLDKYFKNEEIDFIKADIEGAEPNMLAGAKNILLSKRPVKMALCTYHHYSDADVLQKILTENGFSTTFSKGYMIFIYDKDPHPPYLRKALIRAVR